jgi:hypothetical protein
MTALRAEYRLLITNLNEKTDEPGRPDRRVAPHGRPTLPAVTDPFRR